MLGGLRVLVVDDDADAREVLVVALERWGAEVVPAASVPEAIAAVERVRPDVLVSDIGMPGEDGYALIRKVRALGAERGGGVPAVALTGYARGEDRERVLSAGYQAHVAKPVKPSDLATTVAQLAKRGDPAP